MGSDVRDSVGVPAGDGQCAVNSQQFLYFLPLPHGHGSFRPILAWCVRSGSSHSCSASTSAINRPMWAYWAIAVGKTLTLPPETEPARTLEFGRWDRRQDATEAVQHGTDCHEAAAG